MVSRPFTGVPGRIYQQIGLLSPATASHFDGSRRNYIENLPTDQLRSIWKAVHSETKGFVNGHREEILQIHHTAQVGFFASQ